MDKIIIKDLLARGVIGVNEWEREKPQDILINIELYGDFRQAGEADDITQGVSYSVVTKKAIHYAETARRYTVEALAEDIARVCLEDARVKQVLVRVEKPGAVRFTRSVGVEIIRSQPGG